MRPLCLLAAMAIALAGTTHRASAAPTSWCSGSALSTTTLSPSASGSYTITGCALSGLVNISGTTIPAAGPNGVDVLVAGSTIGSASALQIVGPWTAVDAAGRCAFRVTVRGNTFTEGIFRVQGSLPPNSFINFEGNALSGTVKNALSGVANGYNYLTLISIGSASLITLHENAALSIRNNTISVFSSLSRVHALVFTSLWFGRNSSVSVRDNVFDLTANGIISILIADIGDLNGAPSSLFTFAGDISSFAVDDNTFRLKSLAWDWYAFPFYNEAQGFKIASPAPKGTFVSISGNTVDHRLNTSTTDQLFFLFGDYQFQNFTFANNRFMVNSAAPMLYILTLNIAAGGSIFISNNTYNRTDSAGNITDRLIQFDEVESYVSVVITCNEVIAAGMSGTFGQFAAVYTDDAYTVSLFHRGNTYSWLTSPPTVGQLFYSNNLSKVVEVDQCPQKVAQTTATSTTTPTSTTPMTSTTTPFFSTTSTKARCSSCDLFFSKADNMQGYLAGFLTILSLWLLA